MKSIGETIATLRKEKGMTQSQLAEKMNVTDKAVSKWERDLSCPDINTISKLADVLGVSVEELLKAKKSEYAGSKIKDLFRHPKFGIKQMAGYPMRIILGMMIILPFLSKLAVKGSHLIFGKPKNSLLDEGKEKPQEQQPQQTQVPPQLQQQSQQPVQQTTTTRTTTTASQQGQSNTNLLNKYKNSTTTTSSTTQTVNSNNNVPPEPVRTYIPSPVGVQIVNQQ